MGHIDQNNFFYYKWRLIQLYKNDKMIGGGDNVFCDKMACNFCHDDQSQSSE